MLLCKQARFPLGWRNKLLYLTALSAGRSQQANVWRSGKNLMSRHWDFNPMIVIFNILAVKILFRTTIYTLVCLFKSNQCSPWLLGVNYSIRQMLFIEMSEILLAHHYGTNISFSTQGIKNKQLRTVQLSLSTNPVYPN